MLEKEELKVGDKVILSRTRDGKPPIEFTIIIEVGRGASTICYEASSLDKIGRLKKFNPEGLSFIGRKDTGQVQLTSEEKLKQHQVLRENFIGAYRILERVKKENSRNEVLNNYIPAYELYYGSDDTVYVWTPDDKKGKGFDEYLEEVRENLDEYPVHKLYNILATMITLADGIHAIHMAGLLHLDIKPSNFLVTYNSKFEINPGNISLFDVNTFYSIYSKQPKFSGTTGYRAPEVEGGRADNRSDIYSLGATLFKAVIISDEIGGEGTYKEEYYSQIEQLVFSSKIFMASSVNDNIFLKSKVAKILKRCLAKRANHRYECCEDLINDLKDTRVHLLTEMEKYEDGQRRFEVVERGHWGTTNPTAIMQNLLFENTLLKWVPNGVFNINVLVVGGGTYAQKFVDICLQLGQIPNYQLQIDVVSDEIDYDRNVYLQFRPEIHRFVNLNGSLEDSSKEYYGTLNFGVESWGKGSKRDVEFSSYNLELNQRNVEKVVRNRVGEKAYQYVFIALGDDTLNRYVAEAFVDGYVKQRENCSVNYVVESKIEEEHTKGNPVDINATIELGTIHKELERIAFNAHLLWKNPPEINQEVVNEFREKYNYESSLSFALSIRYKLLGLGIQEDDFEKAADCFSDLVREKGEALLHQLATYEHRRWVIDRLTAGWTSPKNASGKINYDRWVRSGNVRAKNEQKKWHLCIAHSTSEVASLSERWDALEIDDTLDELDQMSIKLHQALKRYAEDIKEEYPNYNEIPLIRDKLNLVESNMKCDYKRYDLELLDNIPSILKKKLPSHLNFYLLYVEKSNEKYETYTPQPIDTRDVVLPKKLKTLIEKLAEHAHDIWAITRIKEGWRNGEQKDDDRLINPCLIPYSELPESEKEFNRNTVLEILKFIIKQGYVIKFKRDNRRKGAEK